MDQPRIIARLHALRTTVRRRLVLYGFIAVLGGGIASLLTIVTLDWLLWFPAALRIVVVVLFLAGFLGATWYWIVKPLRAPLSLEQIAVRLEQRFLQLQDRLSSTVDFVQRGETNSSEMTRRVVTDTDDLVRDLPLESALSLRPLVLRGIGLAIGGALMGLILFASPQWLGAGVARYTDPLGPTQWPRTVSIVPLTGAVTAAVGESVTVRMKIERGYRESLRSLVHLRDGEGRTMALAMQRDADGTFSATIDAVTADLSYWFEAGDDSTEGRSTPIRVVRRPAVVQAIATVEPPPYARDRGVRVHDLADGPVKAPIGGAVTINVQAGKSIVVDGTDGRVGLATETGEVIPLHVDPNDHHKLSARFEVSTDVSFRIALLDEDGFTNRGAVRHAVLAIADAAPSVMVIEPKAVVELTPKGTVLLRARVADDFGIVDARLSAQRSPGGGEAHVAPLFGYLAVRAADDQVEATVEYLWDIEFLSASPGDVVDYAVEAEDNRRLGEGEGQVGRSAPLRIKIISEAEFHGRLRHDLVQIEGLVRQALLDATDVLDRTTAAARAASPQEGRSESEREAVAALAARQARLVRRVADLGGRADEIVQRMDRNRVGNDEIGSLVASLRDVLRQTAAGPLTAAYGALGRAERLAELSERRRALEEAVVQEQAAVDRLRGLIRSLSVSSAFESLVSRTRDLFDRQNALHTRTIKLGEATLGKPRDALSADEAAALKREHRQQEELSADVEDLISRMSQLAAASDRKDPSAAEAVEDALRIARADDLPRKMRAAAAAIESNRTAAATMDQKSAAQVISRMIAALRERDRRKLELLRKDVRRAEDHVAELLEQQQSLLRATQEASAVAVDEAAFALFEEAQQRLKRNATLLADELDELEGAASAGRSVRDAAGPMGRAEDRLREKQALAAIVAQTEAISLLQEALLQLKRLADEAAEEALRRTLDQIRMDLEAALAAQRTVNDGIAGLKTAIQTAGRIGRAEARDASMLAGRQQEVSAMVDQLLPELRKVVVYEWALQRVAAWMSSVRARLDERKIDEELIVTAGRIVRELEKLVGALVETQRLPIDAEFSDSESGGGDAAAQSVQYKALPTVAELLVLKAMQVDINERTKSLAESVDLARAGEADLRNLAMLGEDQVEVRRLTQLVISRAGNR